METHPHFLWTDLFRKKKAGRSELTEILRENVLFQTLTKRELRYLSSFVYERVYQPEESIFAQNDRGLGMYLIVKGRVAIRTQATPGMNETLVTLLNEGSFFGELALVDPAHLRSAYATAMERSVLIGFFKPDLLEILERKPEMGVKLMLNLSAVLGRRLVETTERMSLLSRQRSLAKVHEDIA